MGMPEKPQNGMNIAPDGTIYEILDDGTIKRIGKVSPDGSFEPFGGPKDGIRVRDGIIYRVINGKEVKIGRILPNGEIETISQKIKNETEVSRNKVKIIGIISVCCLIVFFVALYAVQQVWKTREYDSKIKPVYSRYLDEVNPTSESLQGYINQLNKLVKLEEVKYTENKKKLNRIVEEIEARKAEIKKAAAKQAEEARKAEQGKAEPTKATAEPTKATAKKSQSGGGTRIGSLYWSKRSRDKMNWNAAVKYCQNLNEGGYSDWRLPTISELRTTIKNCSGSQSGGSCRVSDNCLGSNCWSDDCYCEYRENNGGYYSKLGDDDKVLLWSSSVHSGNPTSRWDVDFSDGGVDSNGVGYYYYVRCVR